MAVGWRQRYHVWSSSKPYILLTMTFAILVDTFLATFIVPILPYILETRIGLPGSEIQSSISMVLSIFGLAMVVLSPFVGIFIDRFANRKWPLVIGLFAQIMATGLTAAATNIYTLCFSRLFLAGAASVLWIASIATIADTVGSAHVGKTMGIVGPIVGSGAFLGPMVAGVLISSVGYWRTWSFAIAMIVLDLILRLTMTERPNAAECVATNADVMTRSHSEADIDGAPAANARDQNPYSTYATTPGTGYEQRNTYPLTLDATTPLLPTSSAPDCQPPPIATEPLSNTRFFLLILRQRRIIASMLLSIILSAAYNSFNTTLALHVEETFQWGPRQVGLLFLALAGPSVLLGPPVGWLRDSIGVRAPTLLGTGLATVSYLLIGLAGSGSFSWTRSLDAGKGIYIGGLVMMGVAIELTAGICVIEGTLVVDGLEAQTPGIFGPRGGYSRFLSLTSMLYPLGSLVGPLVSGFLTIRFSYLGMNLVMDESPCSACPRFGSVTTVEGKSRLLVLSAILTFLCFILATFFVGFRKEDL